MAQKKPMSNRAKKPKVIGNIVKPKAKVDNNKRKRYVNPIALNYVLRLSYLAALRRINKKDEGWQ